MRKRIPPHRGTVTENSLSSGRVAAKLFSSTSCFFPSYSQCIMRYVWVQLRLLYVHLRCLITCIQLEWDAEVARSGHGQVTSGEGKPARLVLYRKRTNGGTGTSPVPALGVANTMRVRRQEVPLPCPLCDVTLPASIDKSKISASFENGLLEIIVQGGTTAATEPWRI